MSTNDVELWLKWLSSQFKTAIEWQADLLYEESKLNIYKQYINRIQTAYKQHINSIQTAYKQQTNSI